MAAHLDVTGFHAVTIPATGGFARGVTGPAGATCVTVVSPADATTYVQTQYFNDAGVPQIEDGATDLAAATHPGTVAPNGLPFARVCYPAEAPGSGDYNRSTVFIQSDGAVSLYWSRNGVVFQ